MMKPRKETESDEHYIARLESANRELRANNARLSKWASSVSRAVTALACDGSLVFQAMAEKAGVRGHPSVTKAVEMFDSIAHPQWSEGVKRFPIEEWPTDWDFDQSRQWSGDADMQLNSPVADVLEYLEHRYFSSGAKADEMARIREMQEALGKPLHGIVDGLFGHMHGPRKRVEVDIPDEVDRDALAALINDISWTCLDLAQDMAAANEWLRRDLRAAAYRRICGELYRLSNLHVREHNPKFDVKVIGVEVPF